MAVPRISARVQAIAAGVVAILATWIAVIHETTETVRPFSDSLVYLQIARQPFRIAHMIFPKPVMVPVVYRALGADLARIGDFQMGFALVAWSVLGASLIAYLRGRWVRVLAGVLVAAFVLAPFRVGFMTVALSESIDDSLLALVLAGVIALANPTFARARTALCWTTALVVVAWILTRDTNAITALVALAVAVSIWRLQRWAIPLMVLPAIAAVVALWTTGQRPPLPTGIDEYADWPAEMTARRTYALSSAIVARIGDDDGARTFFADRGMPQTDQIATLQHSPATRLSGGEDPRWCCDPTFAPARAWIEAHGSASYLAWIGRHLPSRIGEYASAGGELLAPATLTMYMPVHWKKPRGALGLLRSVTGHWLFALLVVVAAPWTLWRARARPLALVAIVCIASALVGGFFAYYGDARELSRHMYGAGQQVLLGLVLALLARLSYPTRDAGSASEPTV